MAEEAVAFASGEWFKAAQEKLSTDQIFKEATADWEGCVRCIIDCKDEEAVTDYKTDYGIKGLLGMLGMLSKEERVKYKGTGVEKLAARLGYSLEDEPGSVDIAEAVKKAQGLTVDDFDDCVIYASWWTDRGVLKEMEPLPPDKYEDAPFTLWGTYSAWKQLCSGGQTAIQLIMGGKMKLGGNLKYILKHMAAMNQLAEIYKSIPLK
jgi:putative sterol carrier protein